MWQALGFENSEEVSYFKNEIIITLGCYLALHWIKKEYCKKNRELFSVKETSKNNSTSKITYKRDSLTTAYVQLRWLKIQFNDQIESEITTHRSG